METDKRTALAAGSARGTCRPTANVTLVGDVGHVRVLSACHHKVMHPILKTDRTTDLHHPLVHKMHTHWHRAAQLQAARRQVETPIVPKPWLLLSRNYALAIRHRATIVFLFQLEVALATGFSRLRMSTRETGLLELHLSLAPNLGSRQLDLPPGTML